MSVIILAKMFTELMHCFVDSGIPPRAYLSTIIPLCSFEVVLVSAPVVT